MIQLTEEEANKLLKVLVRLRNKCHRTKSDEDLAKYHKQEALCAQKFEYLIDLHTRKYQQFPNYHDLQQEGRVALLSALRSFSLNWHGI